ncbi:hypothetical protein ACFSTD_07295 [Novosphingobium colocasiae]
MTYNTARAHGEGGDQRQPRLFVKPGGGDGGCGDLRFGFGQQRQQARVGDRAIRIADHAGALARRDLLGQLQ